MAFILLAKIPTLATGRPAIGSRIALPARLRNASAAILHRNRHHPMRLILRRRNLHRPDRRLPGLAIIRIRPHAVVHLSSLEGQLFGRQQLRNRPPLLFIPIIIRRSPIQIIESRRSPHLCRQAILPRQMSVPHLDLSQQLDHTAPLNRKIRLLGRQLHDLAINRLFSRHVFLVVNIIHNRSHLIGIEHWIIHKKMHRLMPEIFALKGRPQPRTVHRAHQRFLPAKPQNLTPPKRLVNRVIARRLQKQMRHLLRQRQRNICLANIPARTHMHKPSLLLPRLVFLAEKPRDIHKRGHIVLREQMSRKRTKLLAPIVRTWPPLSWIAQPPLVPMRQRAQTLNKCIAIRRSQTHNRGLDVKKVAPFFHMKQQLQQRAPPFAVSPQPIKSPLDLLQMRAIQLRLRQLALINRPNRLLWPPRVIFHLRQNRIAL